MFTMIWVGNKLLNIIIKVKSKHRKTIITTWKWGEREGERGRDRVRDREREGERETWNHGVNNMQNIKIQYKAITKYF